MAKLGDEISGKVGQVLPNSISEFEKMICLSKTTDFRMDRPEDKHLVISLPATEITKGHRVEERVP